MTIGTLIILLIGFAGGIICSFLLAIHSIDEAQEQARFWRNEALKADRK